MTARSPMRPNAAVIGNVALLLALLAVALLFLRWHEGPWLEVMPPANRWIPAAIALVAYAGFCGWTELRSRVRTLVETQFAASPSQSSLLVAYASQTGFARQLAERSAANLRDAGIAVRLRDLGKLDAATLAPAGRALFVVSTTGEGDPPDPALAFVRDAMGSDQDLSALRYGMLALGDREYSHFCGFGHALDDWLRRCGATSLFDLVEVDNGDEGALRHWQHHLSLMADRPDLPDWTAPVYEPWRLQERRILNPGSVGAATYHVVLTSPSGVVADWQAGDIAEIGPCNAPDAVLRLLQALALDADARVMVDGRPEHLQNVLARSQLPAPEDSCDLTAQTIVDRLQPLPHREYSIASLPADGGVHVLLRRMLRPDGSPGLGSGWLCDHAPLGGEIALRIRSNPNFHPPQPSRPLILVGNGTGIAGLRALLKSRIAAGARRNWLLFGERNAAHDFFYGDEIRRWHDQGFIERMDLAFSRDGSATKYVQHALAHASQALRAWVDDGASIYVCGSLQGMAPGVEAVLCEVLGGTTVEKLRIDGRYRRDVY